MPAFPCFKTFVFSLQTLTKNEEADSHVDKDPGVSQKLHEVVHEQVAFLQTQVCCGNKREND